MLRPLPLALLLAGCAAEAPVPPLDDLLRFHHVQAKGTHNSYHVEPTELVVDEWRYTHRPLDVQLEAEGVRHFELDVHRDAPGGPFLARHLAVIDPVSNCPLLEGCLEAIASWSRAHPLHHPLLVLVELRLSFDARSVEAVLGELDLLVRRALGDGLFTPDMMRGRAATLREVTLAEGWPTLGAMRGKVVVALNESGRFRDAYTRGGVGLEGRAMFVTAEPDQPFAALVKRDDPVAAADEIRALVARGFLVRTRADADTEEARAGDRRRLRIALESGAQLVSTDFPVPVAGVDYHVELPGGTPSRCSPVGAPAACTPRAIEDPAWLEWPGD